MSRTESIPDPDYTKLSPSSLENCTTNNDSTSGTTSITTATTNTTTTTNDNDNDNNDNNENRHKAERKLLRKIDFHLMIPLWILFVFGFLDRVNLGNVTVLGIKDDLHMSGTQLSIAMQVFFVPYILFDVPSNIVMKKWFRPSVWISMLCFLWGITCLCQGLVRNTSDLIVCRFFMGIFEAGFVPGCTYLMAMYYLRHEYQKRFSLFWIAGLVAGAFGGLLAYGLHHSMNGLQGYAGWRWIFIIEGILSSALAIPAMFILADWPDQASFLSGDEKALLHDRMAQDLLGDTATTTTTAGHDDNDDNDNYTDDTIPIATMNHLDRPAALRILSDWKIYLGSLLYLGVTVSGYATALFIPTIVNSLGYSGPASQIHAIPIWLVAAVITLLVSILADRLRHRFGFIIVGVFVACVGYVILLCQGASGSGSGSGSGSASASLPPAVRYLAVFLVTIGTYIVQPIALVWLANNLGGHYKRAIGLALQVGFGNVGGIIASNVFNTRFAPGFTVGYAVSLAFMLVCGGVSAVFAAGLVWENRVRSLGGRDYRLVVREGVDADGEVEWNLGDDDPRFRFTL